MEAVGNNINEQDESTNISRIKFHQVHSKLSEEMDMNRLCSSCIGEYEPINYMD